MSQPRRRPLEKLRIDAIWTFVLSLIPIFFALGVQLVSFVLMAKYLGPSAFGELTVIVSICAIAIELTGLGGGDLLIRAVARKPEVFPGYFGNAIILGAATGLIAILLSLAAAWYLVPSLTLSTMIILIASEVIVGRISGFGEQVAISHSNVVRASVYRSAAALVRLFFITAAIYGLRDFSLERWTWFAAANALVISLVISLDVVRLYGGPTLWFSREELLDGSYFALNQIARASQSNLDRLFLAQVASPAVIGNYGAAARLVQIGIVPMQIITRMYYPNFFVFGEKGPAAVRSYAFRSAAPMVAVSIVSASTITAGAFLVPWLLGQGYEDSANVTMALAWTLPLIGAQYPAADALTVLSLQGLRTAIYVASVLASSSMLAIAAHFGGVGAIITAVYVTNALFAVLLWVMMLTRTRVKISAAANTERAQGVAAHSQEPSTDLDNELEFR